MLERSDGMRTLFTFLIFSLFFGIYPDRVEAQVEDAELSGPPNGQGGWVIVEAPPILKYSKKKETNLLSYRERRKRWGYTGSLGYSTFAPINYEPTIGANAEFTDLYSETANSPLIELQFTVKRNLKLGSIAIEGSAGMYSTESTDDSVEAELSITMFRLGLNLTLDNLFPEPWVAPYVSGGGYVIQKKESVASVSDNESTQVAPYFSVGMLIQLDWIDERSALNAYTNMGLENTFLFVEGRQLIQSSASGDSNFSTDLFATTGLRVEL